jgi:hypothetical protein
MLLDIVRVTGLGRLHRVPAQNTSRPQVCWSVHSKIECRHLAELLRRYPVRGRKRREFEVWATAVDCWSQSLHGNDDATNRALRAHAGHLHELRRYVDPEPERRPHDQSTDGLIAFLGGFFTGEGSFSLDGRALACIHLRADDAPLLHTFHECFGLGRVSLSRRPNVNPSVKWTVCRRAELPRMIAVLDAAMLRGRKRREYDAWRIGAAEYARGRDRDNQTIATAAAALREARAYVEHDVVLPPRASGQQAYIEVLRTFAADEPHGKLTASAYERARERHLEWPTRNTIAAAFRGWARALEAAGLGARASGRARARSGARAV